MKNCFTKLQSIKFQIITLLFISNTFYTQIDVIPIEKDNKLFVCDGDFRFTLNGIHFFTFCVNEPEIGRKLKPGDTLWCIDIPAMRKWAEDIKYKKDLETKYDSLYVTYQHLKKNLDTCIKLYGEMLQSYSDYRNNCIQLVDIYKKLEGEHDISLKMLRETKDELNKINVKYQNEKNKKNFWKFSTFLISTSFAGFLIYLNNTQ
jgi:hypothetical protein